MNFELRIIGEKNVKYLKFIAQKNIVICICEKKNVPLHDLYFV